MHPRQQQRLREISGFFEDEVIVGELLTPIARQEYPISLRLLDYTMTNWAKKQTVMLSEARAAAAASVAAAVPWALFSLYKDWLRFYRRRGFDPFRRRERIYFDAPALEEGGSIERLETTVAQLNFLRWAKIYGILDYVALHKAAIEEDMVRTLAESKRRRQDLRQSMREEDAAARGEKRTKREELSRAPHNKCMVFPVAQQIRFEVLDVSAPPLQQSPRSGKVPVTEAM